MRTNQLLAFASLHVLAFSSPVLESKGATGGGAFGYIAVYSMSKSSHKSETHERRDLLSHGHGEGHSGKENDKISGIGDASAPLGYLNADGTLALTDQEVFTYSKGSLKSFSGYCGFEAAGGEEETTAKKGHGHKKEHKKGLKRAAAEDFGEFSCKSSSPIESPRVKLQVCASLDCTLRRRNCG